MLKPKLVRINKIMISFFLSLSLSPPLSPLSLSLYIYIYIYIIMRAYVCTHVFCTEDFILMFVEAQYVASHKASHVHRNEPTPSPPHLQLASSFRRTGRNYENDFGRLVGKLIHYLTKMDSGENGMRKNSFWPFPISSRRNWHSRFLPPSNHPPIGHTPTKVERKIRDRVLLTERNYGAVLAGKTWISNVAWSIRLKR